MKLKYIVMLLLIIVVALLYIYINPSEVNFLPKCPLYVTTGIYCPGCGSQRATHNLLHFNFLGVLQQNILYAFGLFLLAYHLIITSLNSFLNKNYTNYLYYKKIPLIIFIIIILFWILRNIPIYPFNLLAPR